MKSSVVAMILLTMLTVQANPVINKVYGMKREDVRVTVGRYRSSVAGSFTFIRRAVQPKEEVVFQDQPVVLLPVFVPKSYKFSETLVKGIKLKVTKSRWKPEVAVASKPEVELLAPNAEIPEGTKPIWFILTFPATAPDRFSFDVSYQQPNLFHDKKSHFVYMPHLPTLRATEGRPHYRIRIKAVKKYRVVLTSDHDEQPGSRDGVLTFEPKHAEAIKVQLLPES